VCGGVRRGGFREMMVGGGDQGKVAGVGKARREGG